MITEKPKDSPGSNAPQNLTHHGDRPPVPHARRPLLGRLRHSKDRYEGPTAASEGRGCKVSRLFSKWPIVKKINRQSFLQVPVFKSLVRKFKKPSAALPENQPRIAEGSARDALLRGSAYSHPIMEESQRSPIVEPGTEAEAYLRELFKHVQESRGCPRNYDGSSLDDEILVPKSPEELAREARVRDYLTQRLDAVYPEVEADRLAAQVTFENEGRIMMPRDIFRVDSRGTR